MLSHDALQYLLNKHLAIAHRRCTSLSGKHVTPHVLRHTLAMDLLHHDVDRSVIAPPNRKARIFDLFPAHEIGRELKTMSQWLAQAARVWHLSALKEAPHVTIF
ncbi:hypothetical protein [Mesorhizobium sp. M1403]|uniref:hypothetical protein n=1 Tax=Mesorhizobium sp. M1403 TaxID=2957097 RepID=UPI003337AEFE